MNWIDYLQHTSKIIFVSLLLIGIGCNDAIVDYDIKIATTFTFINKTNDSIIVLGDCGFDEMGSLDQIGAQLVIPNDDTVIWHQTQRRISSNTPEITIDDVPLFIGSCYAIYGDSLKCDGSFDSGFIDKDNYEKREEVSKNNFEFTYRFTEATKEAAASCK